jgi:hypothetical protein
MGAGKFYKGVDPMGQRNCGLQNTMYCKLLITNTITHTSLRGWLPATASKQSLRHPCTGAKKQFGYQTAAVKSHQHKGSLIALRGGCFVPQ